MRFREQNQVWDEMFSPIVEYALARPSHRPAQTVSSAATLIENGAAVAESERDVHLVATAGCLVRDDSGGWRVTEIAHLDRTTMQSTSSVERSTLAKLPAGNRSVQLIGARPFDPGEHTNQRVAVKGALIKDAHGIRLNVTSLQVVDQACTR